MLTHDSKLRKSHKRKKKIRGYLHCLHDQLDPANKVKADNRMNAKQMIRRVDRRVEIKGNWKLQLRKQLIILIVMEEDEVMRCRTMSLLWLN